MYCKKQIILILTLVVVALFAANVSAEKIKVEKLDDLPRHTYKLDIPAADLFENDEALMKLAKEVKADLLADLEKYDIQDKTTLKDYYSQLGAIALIEKDYDRFLELLNKTIELEEKESEKLMAGLFNRAYIPAVKSGRPDLEKAIAENYTELVNALPYEVVGDKLKSTKGMLEMFNMNLLIGMINTNIQKTLDENNGEMSKPIAIRLIGFNQMARGYMPYKDLIIPIIDKYLSTHAVVKEDIWVDRDVVLDDNSEGHTVIACIWDSGLDIDCFGDMVWTNVNEIPGNDVDDDNNGFVDDINGIAYTLESDKTKELLFPIGDVEAERPKLQAMMKGFMDIQANIDSPESNKVKQLLGQMKPEDARPMIESIAKYGNYCHGTHVGGIAAKGNPFIKVMAARLTFSHKMIPEIPTVEQTMKDAQVTYEYVDYFKDNGVRVVNMSWGGDYASVEAALETHNIGETIEERKALARKLFEINKTALFNAMKEAPEILFVASAGNENNDVEFDEVTPSCFDLPNMIIVGAVDQAGEETGFTSFGSVDVYANGFEVESFVPGCDKMKLSGTSQASPQVTNLAAKLLVVKPELTPVELKELIIAGSDENHSGERTIRLINPKKTLELILPILFNDNISLQMLRIH